MKTVNRICQVLAIVFGIASLALFFFDFATLMISGQAYTFSGAQLAFGGTKELSGSVEADMAKSADLLFCFIVTAMAFLFSVFSFKKKGLRYAAPAFGLVAAIYMLVVRLSSAWKFVDTRAVLSDAKFDYLVTDVKYSSLVWLIVIALFAFTVAAAAYLFIDDALEVKASKGSKKTILKRVALFFRDYKSESKKIVWPTLKDVLKNTGIVLVMCLLVGILIWVIDFGLGNLIDLILGLKS